MKINKKILCLMHKNQFGDENKPISAEYNGIYKSLKKINRKTYFFDTHEKKNSIYQNNIAIIKKVKKIKPDLIFCHQSSYEIYKETLEILRNLCDPVLINWCSDDSWRFNQHSILIAKNYDYMVTTYDYSHKQYLKKKINSILSNWGCPDHWLKKNIKKNRPKKYDVTFIGNPYMDRKQIISRLKTDGINVNCYGQGWNKTISDIKIRKIINDSKICLNFSKSKGKKKQTKARIFEITGLETFCLTETSSELKRYFKINKEIVSFDTYDELLKKINFYLKNQVSRNKISKAGFKKCKNFYSYSKILHKILSQIKEKKKKLTPKKDYSLIKPKNSIILNFYKNLSISVLNLFMDKNRSFSVSRRILFELEWRINKSNTYSLKGWCNRLFNYN